MNFSPKHKKQKQNKRHTSNLIFGLQRSIENFPKYELNVRVRIFAGRKRRYFVNQKSLLPVQLREINLYKEETAWTFLILYRQLILTDFNKWIKCWHNFLLATVSLIFCDGQPIRSKISTGSLGSWLVLVMFLFLRGRVWEKSDKSVDLRQPEPWNGYWLIKTCFIFTRILIKKWIIHISPKVIFSRFIGEDHVVEASALNELTCLPLTSRCQTWQLHDTLMAKRINKLLPETSNTRPVDLWKEVRKTLARFVKVALVSCYWLTCKSCVSAVPLVQWLKLRWSGHGLIH